MSPANRWWFRAPTTRDRGREDRQTRRAFVGLAAKTTLRQIFVNACFEPLEVVYVFPLLPNAAHAVSDLGAGQRDTISSADALAPHILTRRDSF
jgi:hypothetical protein